MVRLNRLLAGSLSTLALGAAQDPLRPGSEIETATVTATAERSQVTLADLIDVGADLIANVDDPQAVNAQSVCPGYIASNVQQTSNGFTASLGLAGDSCNVYGTDVKSLTLEVQYQDTDRLNIQITPTYTDSSNKSWYILPEDFVPRPVAVSDASESDSDFSVTWSNEPTFNFQVTRKATGEVLFDTSGSVLIYEDQFIEFVTSLPEEYNLYGLGERINQLRILRNASLTTYAADIGNPIDENIYGHHAFYVDTRYYSVDDAGQQTYVKASVADAAQEYTSYSHGVFLRNAHGQEVIFNPQGLTWRTIGGSIDLTFYSGPTVADVTKQYQTSTVGLPAMQKYDTLGFHQCRWGYNNWSVFADVLANFEKFEIPLEYLWADIDYMHGYRDFDNDQQRFSYEDTETFLNNLHEGGRKFVPIVDAALYIPNPENTSDTYDTYTRGAEQDLFLKNPDGSLYVGAVWPGYTVFPDWHHSEAANFWANELEIWYEKVKFDGVWYDMGEVASFCVGSCGSLYRTLNPVHPPFKLPGEPGNRVYEYPEGFEISNVTEAVSASAASASQAAATETSTSSTTTSYLRTSPTPGVRNVNYPPYVINHVQTGHDLAVHAVSPNATHVDGYHEYDVHSLYGHMGIRATHQGLTQIAPEKRPFIIARSTFAGSGKYAGHWGGDNYSRWSSMYFSISQALQFSLFGIPMFGVDTCGFSYNSAEELCNRWMQLSAFFPFYRNHNVLGAISQEPYQWASVIDATKAAMRIRYALLPYFYTLMQNAHSTGSTVMRALAWEFPNDPSLAAIDNQFLVGPSILVTPVLEPQVDTVHGIFPGVGQGEVWYDWYTQTAVDAQPGVNTSIAAPLGHIPVYVRGGSVLPLQEPALTTKEARQTPWALLAALGNDGTATGSLFLDDGESLHPEATLDVDFAVSQSRLSVSARGEWGESNPLANVTILGVPDEPAFVTFNEQQVSADYDARTQVLFVIGLEQVTSDGAWSQAWTLQW
ncbi:glycosyl hydrolases family 31-domain-containing protein [Aspergillus stella-maris]|uniref:glycosyl hydrolases family 31-domain-containing protein n=1 Tax=Aspergillus stella-maris TaxID=1810926 RepID=UPI003CCD8C93